MFVWVWFRCVNVCPHTYNILYWVYIHLQYLTQETLYIETQENGEKTISIEMQIKVDCNLLIVTNNHAGIIVIRSGIMKRS